MQNFIRKFIIIAALIFIIPAYIRAEDVDLEKIVITPSRIEENFSDTGRDVDVVTYKTMLTSGNQSLAQALTDLTSVNISNYGGPGASSNVRMRGSTAAQVLVMVDGRPINSPRDGEADLSAIPMDNIEKIEVLHGPASSVYGSQAMGGIVNIITRNPPKDKQKIEAFTSFGTFETYIERLFYGAKAGKFGCAVSGQYESSQGSRANSAFNQRGFNAKFDYKLTRANNLNLNCGFNKSNLGTPGPVTGPDSDDKQSWLKNFLDLTWKFNPDTDTGLSARVYNNYDKLQFFENTAGSIFDTAGTIDTQTTTSRGYQLQAEKTLWENFRIAAGFDYTGNFNNSTTTAKHKYIVRAGYLEGKASLFDKLSVNLGVRQDDYSNFGSQIDPSCSIVYSINDDNRIHALASRSFRAPTFNDLYWPDQGWAKGNPELTPEKGMTYELGMDTRIKKDFLLSLTYYNNSFKDLINWVDQSGVWQPVNVNSALINGLELGTKTFLPCNLELGLNYTYLMARDKDTHKYLVYQPRNKVDLTIAYKNTKGLKINFKGQYTDKRFTNADNTSYVKKFFVFGANLSQEIGEHFTFYTSIDNIFNRKYQVMQGYPMPGFSITGGIKADF